MPQSAQEIALQEALADFKAKQTAYNSAKVTYDAISGTPSDQETALYNNAKLALDVARVKYNSIVPCNIPDDVETLTAGLLDATNSVPNINTIPEITPVISTDQDVGSVKGNPLYAPVTAVDMKEITTVIDISDVTGTDDNDEEVPKGTGSLDIMFNTLNLELKALSQTALLGPAQLALVLSETLPALLSTSVQYALTKNTAHWDSVSAQMRARVEEINANTAKFNLGNARNEAETVRTNLAITKVNLATANKNYELACEKITQEKLQTEILHAQVFDTMVDGTEVGGTIKHQNALLAQQKKAFAMESLLRFAKVFTDVYAIDRSNGIGNLRPIGLRDVPLTLDQVSDAELDKSDELDKHTRAYLKTIPNNADRLAFLQGAPNTQAVMKQVADAIQKLIPDLESA